MLPDCESSVNLHNCYNLYSIWAGVGSCPAEDRLLTELFVTRHYNKLSRPVHHVNESVTVELGLVVNKIIEVVCSFNY